MKKQTAVGRRDFVKDFLLAGAAAVAIPSIGSGLRASAPPQFTGPGVADWSRFAYDLHNSRFNSKETILGKENVGSLKLRWKLETDAPIQTTPTVIGNNLYFGTQDGNQYAVDAATGDQKWSAFMGYDSQPGSPLQGVRSSAHYEDGRIYFGTGMAKLHCMDAHSGRELWQVQLDEDPMTNRAQIFCSPTVYKGKVYIGTSSMRAKMACLDAETGAIRWEVYVVPDRKRAGGGSIWNSPAVDAETNTVFFATGSVRGFMPADPVLFTESMLAFDADTGEMLWYDQLRGRDPFDLDYSCHPMVFNATHPSRPKEVRPCVGAGAKSGFYTFNRHTGERLWKSQITSSSQNGGPLLSSTAVAYNRVFVVSNAVGVLGRQATSVTAALHAYTGDITWWVANSSMHQGPVAVANGVFYQGTDDGNIEAIDADNGRQLWKEQLPQGMIRGGMSIANGRLYTSTGDATGWRIGKVSTRRYALYCYEPGA